MALNLEVKHLKLIEAVAEEGGITKAGHRLHLTQSALSHQLRNIEEMLGVALFVRHNKRMILTPAGERLLNTARKVLAELQLAEKEIQEVAAQRDGLLRISTECYTCYHWLPSLIKSFNKQYARVEIRIVADATDRPIQALLEGALDLAIVTSAPANQRVRYKRLFKDELVVILPPGHRLAVHAFIKPEELGRETLFFYTDRHENKIYREVLLPAGIEPGQFTQVRLTEAIIEMVKAGIGVSIMAAWAVQPHIDNGQLVARPLTRRGVFRQWQAAFIKSHSQLPYLNHFIKLIAKYRKN